MLYAFTIASFILAATYYICVSELIREELKFIGGACLFILLISYQTFNICSDKLLWPKQHAEGE